MRGASKRPSNAYGGIPKSERPILANNVIALLKVPNHVCSEARRSVSNVVLRGKRCSRSDRVGRANIDAEGRPTEASRLLTARANGRYAPRTDVTGRRRDASPDVGAYEYAG